MQLRDPKVAVPVCQFDLYIVLATITHWSPERRRRHVGRRRSMWAAGERDGSGLEYAQKHELPRRSNLKGESCTSHSLFRTFPWRN